MFQVGTQQTAVLWFVLMGPLATMAAEYPMGCMDVGSIGHVAPESKELRLCACLGAEGGRHCQLESLQLIHQVSKLGDNVHS